MKNNTIKSTLLHITVAVTALIMLLAVFAMGAPSGLAADNEAAAKTVVKGSNISRPQVLQTGQGFGVTGTITSNKTIRKIEIGVMNKSGKWKIYKEVEVNAKSYDLHELDNDIRFGTLRSGTYWYKVNAYVGKKKFVKLNRKFKVVPSDVIDNLLSNPTTGGRMRIVYTFNTSNCSKVFGVSGYKNARVPQGMTFTGSKYYLVYGMSDSQAIVTYSKTGKRLAAVSFPFNMGHPNGIAWDPITKKCYIFRGYQYKCYSWNPVGDKFGKVPTPYSSSGVSYDKSTKKLYVSSKTHIRVYSADGKFKQKKAFTRCTRTGKHYVQDCGAARGYVFHGISGANKHGTNYLDVYRVADKKYLGTIKINIDETESVIVDNEGFVQLLCNRDGWVDYIWRTPLNVYDLPLAK